MNENISPPDQPVCASNHPGDGRIAVRRWLRVLWICRASALSVAIGVVLAFQPQVHDLFLDVAGPGREGEGAAIGAWWLGFYVTIFWALPVHAVARLAVNNPWWLESPYVKSSVNCRAAAAPRFRAPATWIPRLLGFACYGVAIAAALYAWDDIPIADDEPLAGTVAGAIRADIEALCLFGALFVLYALYRRKLVVVLSGRKGAQRPHINVDGQETGRSDWPDEIFSFFGVAALVYELTIPVYRAIFVDDAFVRLWLFPVLLGAWTPIIGLLARAGYRWRAPFEIAAVLALAVAFFTFGDNHKSDLVTGAAVARPTLPEAIRQWKRVNCEGPTDDDNYRSCPSPIVALISGGASRSGFFAGSSLGLLTDISCEGPVDLCQAPLFSNRLFAISSVSGGSVGAALYAQALAERRDADGGPPCDRGQSSPNYFRDDDGSWRGCLQKILASDFLSPVITGLGFRDVFGFLARLAGPCHWPDRGHLIEMAISRSYLIFKDKDHPEQRCSTERTRGLDRGFASLAPVAAGSVVPVPRWKPVLLLNSTDAQTGKRFIFSGVTPGGEAGNPRWLEDAYDFHEAFPNSEIRIVAAAHDSARFPVVSPAGALFDHCDVGPSAGLLDRLESVFVLTPCAELVDGGYFDNYGAATARDLVEALITQGKLRPFVLLIANDPRVVDHAAFADMSPTGRPNDLQGAAGFWLAPLIAAPAKAVVATASARGELAIEELRRLVAPRALPGGAPQPDCLARGDAGDNPCFAMIAVHSPTVKNDQSSASIESRLDGVSMSWWLSKPVQQYLDNQLELPAVRSMIHRQRDLARGGFEKNAIAMNRVCEVLGDAPFARLCKDRVHALAHVPPP